MATPDEVYELAAQAYGNHPPVARALAKDPVFRAAVDAAFAAGRRAAAEAIRAEKDRIHRPDFAALDGLVGMASRDAYDNAAKIAEGSPS
jgi:hypothetical protein